MSDMSQTCAGRTAPIRTKRLTTGVVATEFTPDYVDMSPVINW
jgi:hypothetical protein